jgi:hypothetical protein
MVRGLFFGFWVMGVSVLGNFQLMIEVDGLTSIHTHAWNSARCILDFLGHVYGAVDSLSNRISARPPKYQTLLRATNDKSSRSSHLAHDTSTSHRRPASKVLELAKDIADRSPGSENPERYDDNEKSDNEHDENDNIEDWQVLGGEDVEGDGEGSHGHCH